MGFIGDADAGVEEQPKTSTLGCLVVCGVQQPGYMGYVWCTGERCNNTNTTLLTMEKDDLQLYYSTRGIMAYGREEHIHYSTVYSIW